MNNCQGSGSIVMNMNRIARLSEREINKDYFGLNQANVGENGRQRKSKLRRPLSRQHSNRILNLARSLHQTEFEGVSRSEMKNLKLRESKINKDSIVPALQLDHCSSMGDLPTLAPSQSSQQSSRQKLQVVEAGFIRRQIPSPKLLESYRDVQTEQLQKIITWKQNQIQLLKKRETALRKDCHEEIEKMSKETKILRRRYQDQEKSAQKMRKSLNSLEKELRECKDKLKIRMQLVKNKQVSDNVFKTQPNSQTNQVCSSCTDLKSALQNKQKQLVRTTRLNSNYQQIICNLELANRFYRKEIDKAGISKSPDFIEAQNKMLDRQMQRRRI